MPKAKGVSVISVNMVGSNAMIKQPLLAAEMFEVEAHPWKYQEKSMQ